MLYGFPMRERKQVAIADHYATLMEIQDKLREIAALPEVDLELAEDPPEPRGTEQLMGAMAIVRGNILRAERALNSYDRRINGCETRTAAQVRRYVERDTAMLAAPSLPSWEKRDREEIEGNLAYDQWQLHRM
jgi:hypothetical protein